MLQCKKLLGASSLAFKDIVVYVGIKDASVPRFFSSNLLPVSFEGIFPVCC